MDRHAYALTHTSCPLYTKTNRYIAQCHLEGTLPVPPLRAPLIRLPWEQEEEMGDDEDDGDGGMGHRRRRADAAATHAAMAAAAAWTKKPSKLNVIPFNEQAQRVVAAFLHVTGDEPGGEDEEEQVRTLLALLKTT